MAHALVHLGHPALGAAPLICFEWLQRPENVLGGAISWTDYRPAHHPRHVRIEHWKTKKMVWQPLEDDHGLLFPEIENLLGRRWLGLACRLSCLSPSVGPRQTGSERRTPSLYSLEHARHLVQEARAAASLPTHVTLAACRHGGMTELGDSDLTEQQIMALSTHATPQAARVYVKRTEVQRKTAARKRRLFIEAAGPEERKPDRVATGGSITSSDAGVARSEALEKLGWGARIRTWEWRNENPLPYHLATPHKRHSRLSGPHGGRKVGWRGPPPVLYENKIHLRPSHTQLSSADLHPNRAQQSDPAVGSGRTQAVVRSEKSGPQVADPAASNTETS